MYINLMFSPCFYAESNDHHDANTPPPRLHQDVDGTGCVPVSTIEQHWGWDTETCRGIMAKCRGCDLLVDEW